MHGRKEREKEILDFRFSILNSVARAKIVDSQRKPKKSIVDRGEICQLSKS
jgi:hypothetical protein